MLRRLRTQISLTITVLILLSITLITILSDVLIQREFKRYIQNGQKIQAEEIADNLGTHYNTVTGGWDAGFVHGVGMYSLYDGFVLKISDKDGNMIWDAENHNMSLCAKIMEKITATMDKRCPGACGKFQSTDHELLKDGEIVGMVAISYYGPYFLSENDFRFLDTMNFVMALVGVLSLIGALTCGFILARRISRPIIKTAHVATQIAKGNYGVRFEGETKARELQEMALAVNHMVTSLERQENLRKQLTSDVAHELRTPLTAVSSHLEAMIEGVWEPTSDRLLSCYEEIGRIAGLVSDLEQLAKVESDNLKLIKTPVQLLEVVKQVSSSFEGQSEKKGIHVTVQGQPLQVLADRDRLHQVVVNLLSNAIKYTGEGGHIKVSIKEQNDEGLIVVEDDGIGIPEGELELIFERFYRTDKSRNRKTGGAGIGLAIVKSIVIAHGGRMEVTSKDGEGSCFTVVLPKE